MTRTPIEPIKGAILPTKRGLWDAAREKLQEAQSALLSMQASGDRISYEIAWGQFVDSLEEFWTRFFDEGKTTFERFQPWAGAFDRERREDETLQYIYQARHQSQHGRLPMTWEQPKLIIGLGFAGRMYGLRIHPDGTYEADATSDQPHGQPFRVEHAPGNPVLPTIENKRHKQIFPPPTMHRGALLGEVSPIEVARLVLAYYSEVLNLAVSNFCLPSDA